MIPLLGVNPDRPIQGPDVLLALRTRGHCFRWADRSGTSPSKDGTRGPHPCAKPSPSYVRVVGKRKLERVARAPPAGLRTRCRLRQHGLTRGRIQQAERCRRTWSPRRPGVLGEPNRSPGPFRRSASEGTTRAGHRRSREFFGRRTAGPFTASPGPQAFLALSPQAKSLTRSRQFTLPLTATTNCCNPIGGPNSRFSRRNGRPLRGRS